MTFLENRIPPPLLFALTALVMWLAARITPPLTMSPSLRLSLAVAFLLAALIGPLGIREFVKARTTIDPVRIERASRLVTSGVFGFTRNPMYLAFALILIAWAIFLSAPWLLLGPLLFAAFITRFQIIPEERAMLAKFGADYRAYRDRVRRWI